MIASAHIIILPPFQGLHYLFCYSIPLHGMFGYIALSGLIKLTVSDKIEETITQSLQQAETLRQSILKKAFEGKLVEAPKGRDNITMGAVHREEDAQPAKALKGA